MASKSKKLLGNIAQIGLPIIGGIFGGPAGAALGGAAGGALSGKTGALKQAGIGALSGFGGAKLLGMGGGSSSGIMSKLNPMNLFGSSSTSTPSALTGLSNFTSGGSFSNISPNLMQAVSQPQSILNSFGGSLLKSPTKLGIGSLLASQLLPKPKVPELPQSFENYRNMVSSGGTQVGQLGQSKLQEMLGTNMTAATEDELNAATHDLELAKQNEIDQVRDLYRNIRPGSDPMSDSAYRKDLADVTERYDRAITQTRASLRRDVTSQNNQQRLQQIIASSGLNQEQMNQLAQVAQWDLYKIMEQFNLDADSAQQLKQFLMDEGAMLLNSGMGVNQNPLMSLFGRA